MSITNINLQSEIRVLILKRNLDISECHKICILRNYNMVESEKDYVIAQKIHQKQKLKKIGNNESLHSLFKS